jgi:hypothetical protein
VTSPTVAVSTPRSTPPTAPLPEAIIIWVNTYGDAATTPSTVRTFSATANGLPKLPSRLVTWACAVAPRIRSLSSRSNPPITARTMISAITPTVTPPMEMKVMIEMNVCFRFARRYFRAM